MKNAIYYCLITMVVLFALSGCGKGGNASDNAMTDTIQKTNQGLQQEAQGAVNTDSINEVGAEINNIQTVEDDLNFDDLEDIDSALNDIANI